MDAFAQSARLAAWIGTVPRQNSSGSKQRLGRVTKQGNDYLRTLLFQGARSAVLTTHRRDDRLSRWIVQLQARVGYYKALVVVANACTYSLGRARERREIRSIARVYYSARGDLRNKQLKQASTTIHFALEDATGKG